MIARFQHSDRTDVDLYRSLPSETLYALDRYLEHGIYPGDTLGSVLANDLMQTFARGDEAFISHLRVLMRYLFNRCPSGAWGSDERVRWWTEVADTKAREAYLQHYDTHRDYVALRRQQDKDFAESCRLNDSEPDKE